MNLKKYIVPTIAAGMMAIVSCVAPVKESHVEPSVQGYPLKECVFDQLDEKDLGIYVKDLELCMPEVVEAKNSGKLKGILYNPSDEILKNIVENEYNNEYSYESKYKIGDQYSIFVFPSVNLSSNISSYIIIRDDVIETNVLNNREDLKSLIIHEIQHVSDIYDKSFMFQYNSDFIERRSSVKDTTISNEFYRDILELRAFYKELENTYTNFIMKGDMGISEQKFNQIASEYNSYWTELSKVEDDFEKLTKDYQFSEFENITPSVEGDILYINFKLFDTDIRAIFKDFSNKNEDL